MNNMEDTGFMHSGERGVRSKGRSRRISKNENREESCKLISKTKKDGTVIKEIRGKCPKEQLDVLLRQSNEKKGDHNHEEET